MAGLASEAGEAAAENVTPTTTPALSIVIVGYNSLPELGECLASVRNADVGLPLEIILVDNASSDGTLDFVRGNFPHVRIIANRLNVGYSRAVNQGVAEALAPYVLVLNPDIVVLTGSIERLKSFMDEHPDVGIAGSRLLNPDDTLQHSCRKFYTFWTLVLRRTPLGRVFRNSRAISAHLMLDFDHQTSREVDWVIGACMMVRKSALNDVGGMDERFFLYFEDVDWCYRVWQSGWKVFYVADSVMKHRHTRDSARPRVTKQSVIHGLSMVHFYEKWGRAFYGFKKYQRVLMNAIRLVSDLIAINGGFALAYVLRSSLRGLLEKPMFGISVYETFLPFANLIFVLSFAFFGLYSSAVERERGEDLVLRVFRASAVAVIVLLASTFLASERAYSRVLVGAFCVLAFILVVLLRAALRRVHNFVRAGRFDLTRVAVVGTGETARRVAERLLARSSSGYDLAGLIAADGEPRPAGLPVIGRLEQLPELIERQRIGEVVFADPSIPHEMVADFLIKARRSAVDVKMVSGLTSILTRRAKVEEFLDVPVVAFEREALLMAGAGVKRLLDLIFAAAVVALWTPFLAVQSLARLLRGSGAPLATIARAGRGGRTFSMVVLRPDERPGTLRRFAERHGLSWAPAALDILGGRMSFVGPRPSGPVELDGLDLRDRVRFDARPGVTGLAQVASGESGALPDEAGALDAYYVQGWSLSGDVRILMRWLAQCVTGRAEAPPTRKTAVA